MGSWHKAPRVRAAALLWLRCTDPFSSLSWLLVLKTIFDKCQSFTNVGVALTEVALQVPWNSHARLQSLLIRMRKGMVEAIFIFSWEQKKRKGELCTM